MWRCVSSQCRHLGAEASPPITDTAGALCVTELPVAPLAPLYLDCCACSTRMVACECCHALIVADREVDGVLLCTRCGFLTVLDVTLRALVQIPPFSRTILRCVAPSVGELDRLKSEWVDWEARARLAQQRTASEGDSVPAVKANTPPPTHKRRRRPDDDGAVVMSSQSEPVLPTTPKGRPSMSAELKTDGKRLQEEIRRVKRQWQRLLDDAAGEATARNLQSLQQPMFSSTHLHILKIMYEKTMDRVELVDLVAQIEEFLLHQSTVVNAKYDLLAGVRSCQQLQQLSSIVPTSGPHSSMQAVKLMIHSAEEQVRFLQSQFDANSRQYLRLVGVANRHLFALYNAAQSLSKMQSQRQEQAPPTAQSASASGNVSASPASFLLHDNSRKRRLFGSSGGRNHSDHDADATTEVFSRVQQDIELRRRISEIAKKIEVWRGLSFTVASCCVLSMVELAQTQHQPHS